MKSKTIIFIVSIFLLGFCFCGGFSLARQKPLWNDEFYTQVSSIYHQTYGGVILGHTPEGNNYPLFYLIQKSFCDIFNYVTPAEWVGGHWADDSYSKIFLRINPNIFMSLAIASIFYYFSRFYSILSGVYSLVLSFSSYMVWNYWAEARPYALWCFLTTLQFLSFIYVFQGEKERRQGWKWLVASHCLLAVAVVFGLMQIVFASLLVWIFLERRWRRFIWLSIAPVIVSLYYYFHAPRYHFCFSLEPEQLIRECFSRDRLYVLLLFVFFLVLYLFQEKFKHPRLFQDDTLRIGIPHALFTITMLLGAILVLLIFKLRNSGDGFAVTSRYFIYLTPVGVITTVLLSTHLMKALRGQWWLQVALFVIINYWVLARVVKNIPYIEMFLKR